MNNRYDRINSRQNAKLNMAERTLDTMTRHENAYLAIAPVTATVTELKEQIDHIHATLKERSDVNVPASTLEKRAA